MISRAIVTEWRSHVPWKANEQVEQDLLIGRALVELFADPVFADNYAFRGGTALHKLYMQPQVRYSEDIDLIQIHPEKIGPAMKYIRKVMKPFMGEPLTVKQRNYRDT